MLNLSAWALPLPIALPWLPLPPRRGLPLPIPLPWQPWLPLSTRDYARLRVQVDWLAPPRAARRCRPVDARGIMSVSDQTPFIHSKIPYKLAGPPSAGARLVPRVRARGLQVLREARRSFFATARKPASVT